MNTFRIGTALAAGLAVTGLLAGCGGTTGDPGTDAQTTSGPAAAPTTGGTSAAADDAAERTRVEQDFLDDLTARGVATDTAAETAVEVGLGICRGLEEGADEGTVLEQIRPFTSALAARDGGTDAAGVGREFLEASRAHLCG